MNASTAVEKRPVAEVLATALEVDSISQERLRLIKATVAKDATDSEVGMFLELAAKYDLDPFAHEVWCVKSKGKDGGQGNLLIMVGRDGLRKIAHRNNIHIDGDVVRENDEFTMTRTPTGNRTVAHSWGKPHERGEIVGAWAECRASGPEGTPLGFFYAPLSEYRPTSEGKLKYSPWGSQESVMILAAAERQALRQATPLSGLLVEGEGEINDEIAEGRHGAPLDREALLDAIIDNIPEAHQERARDLIDEMNSLAPGHWTPGKIEMIFKGKGGYDTSVELASVENQIEELRARPEAPAEDIADAEVVDEPAGEQPVDAEPDPKVVEEVEALRLREDDLEQRYDAADDGTREQEELAIELEQVRQAIRDAGFTPRIDAGGEPGPGQDSLL